MATVLVIGGVSSLYLRQRRNNAASTTTPTPSEDFINLDPPTEEDTQRVEDNKQKIVDQQGSQPTPPAGATVKPVITYAQQYGQVVEVGAEVPVFENGGTCTATFTLGAATVTKTVQAVTNVNRVNCPVMAAEASEFYPKGSWSVTVGYKSASTSGTSDSRLVEVK